MSKISEVSKRTGLSKRTLQYYDDEGLLHVPRSPDNYRMYDGETMQEIWEILVYKEMGFKLSEIKCITTLSESEKNEYMKEYTKRLKKKKQTMEEQIELITSIQKQHMFPKMPEDGVKGTYVELASRLRKKENRED